MPKGQMQMTGEQRAVKDAQQLAETFANRFSKKLDVLKNASLTKDLRANLRSFQGAASKQLKELSKDAASRGPKKPKPAPTSKPKKSTYAKRKG